MLFFVRFVLYYRNTCIAGMAILMFVGCSLDSFVGLNDVQVNKYTDLYVQFRLISTKQLLAFYSIEKKMFVSHLQQYNDRPV